MLVGACLVYAVITITYALGVPVGGSADELSHLNYARLIADHASLPGATVVERQQPPLYYLLSAGLLRLGGTPVALRFLSIALGAVTIACVALAVRRLAPRRPWLAVGAATAMALLPGFQFVSASITDDSIATAAAALLVLVIAHVLTTPSPTPRLLLAVGCSAAIGLLAKETDLPVLIVLAGAVGWRWHHRLSPGSILTIGVPVVAIAGWWYVRNLVTFHRPLPPLTPIGVAPNKLRTASQLKSFFTQSVRGLFSPERYQGAPLTLPLAGRVLLVVLAVSVVGLVGAGAVLGARSWPRWDRSRRAAAVALVAAAAGAAAFSLANAVLVVFQPQGRYLLVAAVGPLLALVWVTPRLARTRRQVGAVAVGGAAGAVALSVIGLTTAIAGMG